MKEFIVAHPATAAVVFVMVFSNGVGAMPSPTDKSSTFYRYCFGMLHGLAGNILYAARKTFPQFFPQDGQ